MRRGEIVHHRNGQRADNRVENLELWFTAHPHGIKLEEFLEDAADHLGDFWTIVAELRGVSSEAA